MSFDIEKIQKELPTDSLMICNALSGIAQRVNGFPPDKANEIKAELLGRLKYLQSAKHIEKKIIKKQVAILSELFTKICFGEYIDFIPSKGGRGKTRPKEDKFNSVDRRHRYHFKDVKKNWDDLDKIIRSIRQKAKTDVISPYIIGKFRDWQKDAEAVNPSRLGIGGTNEYYSPKRIIEPIRNVLGQITLDPASCGLANKVVKATCFFDSKANSLDKPWGGHKIYCNPPYESKLLRQFVDKLCTEDFQSAIVLVNNSSETEWWQKLASHSNIICQLKGRLSFWNEHIKEDSKGSHPLHGSTLFGMRVNETKFQKHLSELGICFKKV